MKLLTICVLLFVIFIKYSSAQWQRCHGKLWIASCIGPAHRGHQGPICQGRLMWYYDRNMEDCRPVQYMGCGGNSNRWCSKNECEQRCQVK
ncbi:mambaquaretin-9-like [Cochliomyia hominivorax]